MQAGRSFYQSVLWRGLHYITAFVFNILIARHFEASLSGSIYYICNIYSMALIFAGLSFESGIIFFASKHQIAIGRLLNFSLLWTFLTGIFTFCLVYFTISDSIPGYDKQLLLVSSITFICGNLLITYCTGLFYSRGNFLIPHLLGVGTNLMLILILPYKGNSIFRVLTDANYFYIYFTSFFVQGIIMALVVQLKYIKLKFEGLLTYSEFKLLFRYCAMAFAANIIFFFLYRIDYWFVERYCTAEQLGNYVQVSKLGQLFFLLPTILASVVFPLTAGGQRQNVNSLLTLIARSILFVYLIVCLALVFTGKWLFPLVFGESFSGMYQSFLFLIPGILSLSGLFTLTAYYAGKNRIKVNITGSLLALFVIVAGDSIFIPVYGINAAALVSSIGYIVYQIYVLLVFKKEYQTSPGQFFIFRLSDWQIIKQGIRRNLN